MASPRPWVAPVTIKVFMVGAVDDTYLVFFWPVTGIYYKPPVYFTGTSDNAPLSFTKNTRNFAGLVLLAFFETV